MARCRTRARPWLNARRQRSGNPLCRPPPSATGKNQQGAGAAWDELYYVYIIYLRGHKQGLHWMAGVILGLGTILGSSRVLAGPVMHTMEPCCSLFCTGPCWLGVRPRSRVAVCTHRNFKSPWFVGQEAQGGWDSRANCYPRRFEVDCDLCGL